jgi:hypothetical protein
MSEKTDPVQAVTNATLPADECAGTEYSFTAVERPVVVNGRWHIPLGASGTFRSYRFWPFKKLRWRRIKKPTWGSGVVKVYSYYDG